MDCAGGSSALNERVSSHLITKSSTAILTSWFGLWNKCCAVFASSESSQLSTDQGHEVKLPGVRRVLSSVHAVDQLASCVFAIFLSIFRWKTHICLWAVFWTCALLMS